MKASGILLVLLLFNCNRIESGSVTIEDTEFVINTGYELALEIAKTDKCRKSAQDMLGVELYKELKQGNWFVTVVDMRDIPLMPENSHLEMASFVNCSWGWDRIGFNKQWVDLVGPIPAAASWLHEVMHIRRCAADDGMNEVEEEVVIQVVTQDCVDEFVKQGRLEGSSPEITIIH